MKLIQETKTSEDFVNKNISIADTLIKNATDNDLESLKVASKFYSNAAQMLRTQILYKHMSVSSKGIKFLDN